MTEVKTIGDYINALPDEIREEVRRLNTPENFGNDESELLQIATFSDPFLYERPLNWMFSWDNEQANKWLLRANKYTLTEKEGKYYTNW